MPLKKCTVSFSICYAAAGTNRWFPNRPVCILWCSFRMLNAILTRYHSTVILAFPLVRKRRKFISSLIVANTPSAWMDRLTRSRIPSSVEIFFSIASRCWMKYLETSSLLDTVFHWLFVSLLLMIVLFFDRAVFTVRTFVDNLYNLLASCCTS